MPMDKKLGEKLNMAKKKSRAVKKMGKGSKKPSYC